jgi:hypothetical protein
VTQWHGRKLIREFGGAPEDAGRFHNAFRDGDPRRAFDNSASRIHSDFSSPLLLMASSISVRSAGNSRAENPGVLKCFLGIFGLPIFFARIFVLQQLLTSSDLCNTEK